MDIIRKDVGVIVILIGALILIIPGLMYGGISNNNILIASLIIIVIGLLIYIFGNKKP
jgi:hypothetical protein